MSIWDNLLGRGSSDAASGYLNQIPGELHGIMDPYINRGNDQYGNLNSMYGSMASDPSGYLNKMLSQYQQSKGYQLQRDEATRAAGNSAAAGGQRGSLADITNQSRLTDSLMGNDMQQWLQNAMGIQNEGLAGQQHFYDQGYESSTGLAGDLSNLLGSQASNAFAGRNQENAGIQGLFSALLGAGGATAGQFLGGGKKSGGGMPQGYGSDGGAGSYYGGSAGSWMV